MKKSLLFGALALSLAANAYLLLAPAYRSTEAAKQESTDPRLSESARTRTTAAAKPSVSHPNASPEPASLGRAPSAWSGDFSAAALRQLGADLEASGLPPHAVRAALEAMISRHVRASSEFAQLPFWQQGYGGPRFKAEADKMNARIRELNRAVFGADDDSPDLDPITRNVHFGDLPPAKIAALMKLERDYSEVYRSQLKNTDGSSAADTAEGRLRLRLIEDERMKDVAAALTPEEFKAWELRNSRPARNVIQGAKNTELSAAEYDALLEIQRAYEAAIPTSAGPAETVAALRGWAAPVEQLRAVLNDDRLYAYLEGADPLYGVAAKFAATNSLPREQTNALYQLQLDAVSAVAQAAGPAKAADFANTAAGRAVLAPFDARLTALLGAERAAIYRKTSAGKLFVISR